MKSQHGGLLLYLQTYYYVPFALNIKHFIFNLQEFIKKLNLNKLFFHFLVRYLCCSRDPTTNLQNFLFNHYQIVLTKKPTENKAIRLIKIRLKISSKDGKTNFGICCQILLIATESLLGKSLSRKFSYINS